MAFPVMKIYTNLVHQNFPFSMFDVINTGWTNINLLYFPDSIEIASLQDQCSDTKKLTNQNRHWYSDEHFQGLKTTIFHCVADIAYF